MIQLYFSNESNLARIARPVGPHQGSNSTFMCSYTVTNLLSVATIALGLNSSFPSPTYYLREKELPSDFRTRLRGIHICIDVRPGSDASTNTTSSSAPTRRSRKYRAGCDGTSNDHDTKCQGLQWKRIQDRWYLWTPSLSLKSPAGSRRPHTSTIDRVPH